MKKIRRLGLSLALAVLLTLALVGPALAANPTVTITISARIVSITNSEDTWNIGPVAAGTVAKYFSVDNLEDQDYSIITNNGNVAVDVAIQGTNFTCQGVPSTYNWTLAAAAANKTLSIHANNETQPAVYDIEVKNAPAYSDICTDLAKDATCDWSMKMMTPTGFDPADEGDDKVATITLVARIHT